MDGVALEYVKSYTRRWPSSTEKEKSLIEALTYCLKKDPNEFLWFNKTHTVLHEACGMGNTKLVEKMLELGYNHVNLYTKRDPAIYINNTALGNAVRTPGLALETRHELCKILFKYGALPDLPVRSMNYPKDVQTPLQVAVANDHFPIVKVLVEEGGANPALTTGDGRTTEQLARNAEIVKYLRACQKEKKEEEEEENFSMVDVPFNPDEFMNKVCTLIEETVSSEVQKAMEDLKPKSLTQKIENFDQLCVDITESNLKERTYMYVFLKLVSNSDFILVDDVRYALGGDRTFYALVRMPRMSTLMVELNDLHNWHLFSKSTSRFKEMLKCAEVKIIGSALDSKWFKINQISFEPYSQTHLLGKSNYLFESITKLAEQKE